MNERKELKEEIPLNCKFVSFFFEIFKLFSILNENSIDAYFIFLSIM